MSETNQEHPKIPGKQIWLTCQSNPSPSPASYCWRKLIDGLLVSIQPLHELSAPVLDATADCQGRFGVFIRTDLPCYGPANHDTRGGKAQVGKGAMYGAQLHGTQKADWKLPNPGHYWDAKGKKHGWNGASATKEELH